MMSEDEGQAEWVNFMTMSVLIRVSNAFYDVCTFLAKSVERATDGATYVIQLNYNLVTAVCSVVLNIVSAVTSFFLQTWNVLHSVFTCLSDFLLECYNLLTCTTYFVWKGVVSVYSCVELSCLKVGHFLSSCAHLISQTYLNMKQAAFDVYEGASYLIYLILDTMTLVVTSSYLFVTSVGNGCVNFVTGVWQGLGFVLSSVAYFPVYCLECVESAKDYLAAINIHALTSAPKETYLGVVCFCLLYFMLSNTFRYLSCHGLPLFTSRMRRGSSRRRGGGGHGTEWHFDRGFESDFEDLYNSDAEDRSWRRNNNRNASVDGDESDAGSESEDDNGSSASNDSGTVDNDLSDEDNDDEDSDDSQTVVTEESDSDASLNSQTFSTESSDHEIEVQLPSVDERYSLRSRSSTPCRQPNPLNSPEAFDREMERERDKRKCVVCQDQIKSVLVMPCRHMCMCVDCADHIVRSRFLGRKVCPLCRTRIQKVMNVYV